MRSNGALTMHPVYRLILLVCLVAGWNPVDAQMMENGYVLQAAGRLLFIDKGEQDNVRPGDLLQVVRQEVIRHPETGENLAAEVKLGAVRVVEVFPRLSTAEIVNLIRGMNIEKIDEEARQGIIRVKVLPPEEAMLITQQVQAKEKGMAMPVAGQNPDGALGQIIPTVKVGFGSRAGSALPGRVYQLIGPNVLVSDRLADAGLALPDSAYNGIASAPLLTLADTNSVDQALASNSSSLQTQIGLAYPLSSRLTALAQLSFGLQSEIMLGARFYPGRLFGFLGQGMNADGLVGEPVLTFTLGRGGQGSNSLSASAQAQLNARSDLTADTAYLSALDPSLQASADSLFRADVNQLLRTTANDTVGALVEHGLGFGLQMMLPLGNHFTFRSHWLQMGNVKELGAGLTYFMRAGDPGMGNVNPDGVTRSLVIGAGWRYLTEAKDHLIDLDVTMPITQRYTIAAGVQSDLSNYTRFGFSFRTYLRGF